MTHLPKSCDQENQSLCKSPPQYSLVGTFTCWSETLLTKLKESKTKLKTQKMDKSDKCRIIKYRFSDWTTLSILSLQLFSFHKVQSNDGKWKRNDNKLQPFHTLCMTTKSWHQTLWAQRGYKTFLSVINIGQYLKNSNNSNVFNTHWLARHFPTDYISHKNHASELVCLPYPLIILFFADLFHLV